MQQKEDQGFGTIVLVVSTSLSIILLAVGYLVALSRSPISPEAHASDSTSKTALLENASE